MAPIQQLWSNYRPKGNVPEPKLNNGNVHMAEVSNNTIKTWTEPMTWYELPYNGLTLRYTVKIIGTQPRFGFPLYLGLHGGGGPGEQKMNEEPDWAQEDYFGQNNSDWFYFSTGYHGKSLDSYYDSSRNDDTAAVYIAVRGITDTWDLHFRPESYAALEMLIQRLIRPKPAEAGSIRLNAPTFVNPDRVYLMGFSAGGDGVYRQATNLSDRFAAVDMSAGHPGGVSLKNLANLPMCLQVGERDTAFFRHALTAKFSIDLDSLANGAKAIDTSNSYYTNSCYIHPGGSHNSWNSAEITKGLKTTVIAKNSLSNFWSKNKENADLASGSLQVLTDTADTNVVNWVRRFNRNPTPSYVIWDIASRPDRPDPTPADWKPKRFFYYIMIPADYTGSGIIEVTLDKSKNTVWIKQAPVKTTVLLNPDMLRLNEPIIVLAGNDKKLVGRLKVTEDDRIQQATLDARGDPRLVFSAAIVFDPVTGQVKDGLYQRDFGDAKL